MARKPRTPRPRARTRAAFLGFEVSRKEYTLFVYYSILQQISILQYIMLWYLIVPCNLLQYIAVNSGYLWQVTVQFNMFHGSFKEPLSRKEYKSMVLLLQNPGFFIQPREFAEEFFASSSDSTWMASRGFQGLGGGQCLGFWGFGFRAQDFGLWAQGLGFQGFSTHTRFRGLGFQVFFPSRMVFGLGSLGFRRSHSDNPGEAYRSDV